MGLDSKDLNECLSQMLAVGGKKEKAVLRKSTRHTEDEFGQKKKQKWQAIVYLYPCAGYKILSKRK